MADDPKSELEMREYALHHKQRRDAIKLLEEQPDRLPLWAVCLLLSSTNNPNEHRQLAARLTSLTQTRAINSAGQPYHEFEPNLALEMLRRDLSGPVPFPEVKRDMPGNPSRDHSAYSVELLRDDVQNMLETDGLWPLEDSVPLSRWFPKEGDDSFGRSAAPRSHDRNMQLQAAANELARRWKHDRPAGFTKREIANELARSDDWRNLKSIRIERLIKVEW
jgi:hypothetical protein